MTQVTSMLLTLKQELKGKGKTYADVANHLKLSENSIKRLFSEKSFSIGRLEKVSQMIDLEISDLVQIMIEQTHQIEMLSEQQEEEIANDIKLLLVTNCVLNRWSLEQIIENYQITQPECIQLLAKLDRLKIIELLPGNKVRVIVAKNFNWRPKGPIQKFFQTKVQSDFLKSDFQSQGEKLTFSSGLLSIGSNATLVKKMKRLVDDFYKLNDEDASLPFNERHGTSMVIAIRQWELERFQKLRR